MSLYLWIDLLSLSVPFIVSFHSKLPIRNNWGWLMLAIFLALVPYIIWDVLFTINGVWGFNSAYLMGFEMFSLPIEEWLFFISIPYACIFTHHAIRELAPNWELPVKTTQYVTYGIIGLMVIIAVTHTDKWYTLVDMSFGALILAWCYYMDREVLRSYFITFLFILIPFFIVNGVLTGTGIEDQVVWYNDDENLGIRMLTIPVEDTVYGFSLVLLGLMLFRKFSNLA